MSKHQVYDYDASQQLTQEVRSNAVIQEVLRIHPNTGTIIERLTPPEGAVIDGYTVPGGTVVGINAWVLHRDKDIFGEDIELFRPERWLDASETKKLKMNKYILSVSIFPHNVDFLSCRMSPQRGRGADILTEQFGAGAHSCVGRHVAMIIVSKLVSEFYRRFNASIANPGAGWQIHGGWVTKQTGLDMMLARRPGRNR